ncbi:MAG: type II toxin-antitoxin system HicA family toxin [Planctomycetota bacterium]
MKLLEKDGWRKVRESPHGVAYCKEFSEGVRITCIPRRRKSLPKGTLSQILGPKQTGLKRTGLQRLREKHG